MSTTTTDPDVTTTVAHLIRYLETGEVAEDLFAPDMFADVTLPTWRIQGDSAEAMKAIRFARHPATGQVHVQRVEPTSRGFTIEFDERWEAGGQQWYSREMIRADVVGATIVELSVYCTGDWDEARQREHAAAVSLLRP